MWAACGLLWVWDVSAYASIEAMRADPRARVVAAAERALRRLDDDQRQAEG